VQGSLAQQKKQSWRIGAAERVHGYVRNQRLAVPEGSSEILG
jgi:hypothetical protein